METGAEPTTEKSEQLSEKKIEILFKNTGNAPVIKQKSKKWAVRSSSTIAEISRLLTKLLNLEDGQSLFIYVNQSFAPALDQTIQNLFDCYECDKKLVLYYAVTHAWG